MLARLQKIIVFCVLAAAGAWLLALWHASPVLALVGCTVIVFVHALVLALEFGALRWVNPDDAAAPPDWRELALAWAGEVAAVARVFGWWQPFRSRAVPDQWAPPAVQSGAGAAPC